MKITEKTFHEACVSGWCGNIQRGAGMGRGRGYNDWDADGFAHLIRIRLDSGGYAANGGAYFGHGEPLFWLAQAGREPADGMFCLDVVFRAASRAAAVAYVRAHYPALKVRK